MGVFAGPDIVESGLVLALDAGNTKSYPGSGTTWTDLSGRGNNGTLTNGPTYSNGAIVFDGVDDYVSFTSNPSLTNQISVDVWVNLNTPPTQTNAWILGREGSYRLTYATNTFQWVCATVNNSWYSTGTAINGDTQVISNILNVVGTYDGANNKIYINGTLKTTGAAISGNILTTSTYYLVRSGAVNVDYGKGAIYSHKLYNRALTAAEIQQNYNATKSRYGL